MPARRRAFCEEQCRTAGMRAAKIGWVVMGPLGPKPAADGGVARRNYRHTFASCAVGGSSKEVMVPLDAHVHVEPPGGFRRRVPQASRSGRASPLWGSLGAAVSFGHCMPPSDYMPIGTGSYG